MFLFGALVVAVALSAVVVTGVFVVVAVFVPWAAALSGPRATFFVKVSAIVFGVGSFS